MRLSRSNAVCPRVMVCLLAVVAMLVAFFVVVSPALAVAGGPQWSVSSVSMPTVFAPGDESGDDVYKVVVTNTGGASSDGSPVTVSDVLPEGLSLDHRGAEGFESAGKRERQERGVALSCEGVVCTFSGTVAPDESLIVSFPVDVELGEPGSVTNVVRVAGGGATDAQVSTPTAIGSTAAGFGIVPGSVTSALSSTQAGAHADLTTGLGFDTVNDEGKLAGVPKEIVAELPPGFAGDLVDTPTCSVAVFTRKECPISTQVGVTTQTFQSGLVDTAPVYNLSPSPGIVAKIGFFVIAVDVQGEVSVRPGDYGLQTRFQNIKAPTTELDGTSLTIWGVPSDPVHDRWRWNGKPGLEGEFGASSPSALVPYLSNPTSCSGEALAVGLSARSWQEPERAVFAQPSPVFGPLGFCDALAMPSSLVAVPTTTLAGSATGLDVELGVHQTYENAEGLASAHVKRTVVTLPEGMTVNPSAGSGLGACSPEQYAQEALETPAGQGCPNDSKLGSVRIQAPAIKEEALGSVYVAQPYANPFGSLLALYIVARIPNRGVIVKAAGEVKLDPVTGRLTTVFDDLPQLPYSLFTLSFRQGATSPLVTPPVCGSYTVTAELTPWSDPSLALTDLSEPFQITQGTDGGACPSGGVPPFAPQVVAGTSDNNAGAYSPLYLRLIRGDGEQEITGFATQLPPGLTGNLSGVAECSEAQVQAARIQTGAEAEVSPACPASSEIGHSIAEAGVGSVLAQTPGKIYLGGPFAGAPFSIVAITSAKVGPFDLGTVVVHLPLQIDPITAAVSIPSGPAEQIPHIIKGIVIHVRDIRVYINRNDFTLNPTSCDPMNINATVIGAGANPTNTAGYDPVTVSDPFQAADCQSLAFKPLFKVSTSGKTSKANGASLSVRLTYPSAPQGTQANIKEVKVDLPKQLPSRLTTLQKACTEQAFNTDPASCPAASVVGHATAITPVLPVPLTGPAYFVSHGGAKFPELIIVLQGDGVTIQLHGETFISKTGITSSTFHTVPDQPVTSFELTLPQGKYSALTTNGNLCKTKLVMPTTFVAQNGATIHQNTKITTTNCPKTHKTKKKTRKAKRKHGAKEGPIK